MTPREGVEINLGMMCNNRCVFCMSGIERDHKEPWAPSERIREELEHFRARGCRAVGLLGGEPTVHPQIVESIAYARDLGYDSIALCTNGTRLSDAAFCRKLVEAGLTRVTLSVHSHRADIEDGLITLVPGNLERKLTGLANLQALRREGAFKDGISLNPVLCGPTLDLMEEYIAFYGALGLHDIRFNYIWPRGEVLTNLDWTPPLRDSMSRIVRVMLHNEKRPRTRLSFGGVPRCALLLAGVSGRLFEHLASKYLDEDVFDPPKDVSLADRRGPDARFVWTDVKKNVLKSKGPRCRDCSHEPRCEGVWTSYCDLYGFDELRPLP